VNSIWLILVSACAFMVAYRLYGAFLAAKLAVLNDARATPAHRLNDGVDYHPTNKWVLFGHHFAAIAGPGPLIGPVMAAQWGFAPGFAWIVIGACLAGGVHDFVVMWASVREDGLSLPKIARKSLGPFSGFTVSIATLFIIVTSLASVAAVVVQALSKSSWGMFTIIVTIPAALLTGLWMYKIRPGKVGEATVIGVSIVLLGVFLGEPVSHSQLGEYLKLNKETLALILPAYAFVASILPVWVLMCPRDYLSSYMKIGVMIVLGIGLLIAAPELKMPAFTPYDDGGGPVIGGAVWPFVCITIMCGAVSGFHSLIASGTTPKMVDRESHIRPLAYGAMVLEGFVAVTALIAACALEPGDYFAINSAPPAYAAALKKAEATADFPLDLKTKNLEQLQERTGEPELAGRPGGAVTLAVGMADVFSKLPGMSTLTSYWYHFVIMFEALFILTLLETGTRVARFVFQEALAGSAGPPKVEGEKVRPRWGVNIAMSALVCVGWGALLYCGDLATLWRMLGISNQLLASIALAVGTTYILQHSKRIYALCSGIPFVFVVTTTIPAGIMSIQAWLAEVAANKVALPGLIEKAATIVDPTLHDVAMKEIAKKQGDLILLPLICVLAGIMIVLVVLITLDAIRRWIEILRSPAPQPLPAAGD